MNLTILIVTMIAGLGAGIATGLAGLVGGRSHHADVGHLIGLQRL